MDIVRQLGQLPELPPNVELAVQTSVIEFGELARTALGPSEFSKKFSDLPDNFRDCLLEMKPKFTLRDKSDIPIVEIIDDDSDADSTITNSNVVTPSKRRNMGPPTTPAKRQRSEVTPIPVSLNGHIKPEEGRGSVPPPPSPIKRPQFPEPFTRFKDIGRGFRTLRQVQEEIKAKSRTGAPGIMPEEVYNDLCREAVLPWDGPMKAFLNEIMRLLSKSLGDALSKAFGPLNKRLIYQESRKLLKDYLAERRRETEAALAVVYRLETHGLFTISNEILERCQADEKMLLTRFRHQMRMHAAGYADGKPPVPWESLNEVKKALDTKRREDDLTKIGPDPFERELKVIAYVRGYYRLAALRFADSVALHITNGMIPDIQRQLPYYLDGKLGLRGPDAASVYEMLMAEDEATAKKRVVLKAEREKFQKALASIEGLEAAPATNGFHSNEEPEPDNDVAMMSGALGLDDEA